MSSLGTTPPPGSLELTLALAPVSQQADAEAKLALREAVHTITRTAGFLLTGDVKLSVEWLVSEQARYETDRSPDIDNILKPLIDSFAGPEGLLIDDNQLQHVSCSWIDWNNENEQLRIELMFSPDEWISKKGLIFIQFENGLCLPIPGSDAPHERIGWLNAYTNLLAARKNADATGIPYAWARVLMPRQRVFHRTRIHGFTVLSEPEFRAFCEGEY